jgi:hypothetical protein
MPTAQLYFEDVSVGDAARPMYFYMDQMQLVEWGYVSGNSDAGHWYIWHNRHHQPEDPAEPVARRGQDPTVTGQFKTALVEKMLMDWAGPKAWVTRLDVQYRAWDYLFELKTFSGKVTATREEGELKLVDLDILMANEEGQVTTKGTATLALPSRAKG